MNETIRAALTSALDIDFDSPLETIVTHAGVPFLRGSTYDVLAFAGHLRLHLRADSDARRLDFNVAPAIEHYLPQVVFQKWSPDLRERVCERFDRALLEWLNGLGKLAFDPDGIEDSVQFAASWWVDYLHPVARGRFTDYGVQLYCALDEPQDVDLRLAYQGATFAAEEIYALATVRGVPRRCRAWPDVIAVATALEHPLIKLAAQPGLNFTYGCAGQILVRCGDYKRWFLTDDEAHVFADQRAAIGRGAEVAHLRDVLSGNVEAL